MFYPQELIEEVRLSNDIVDIISQYVTLTHRGTSFIGLCPFHKEKTPSFHVNREKQYYHCFGCGVGGNVITFLMEYENYTFIEALKYLAKRANIVLPEPQMSDSIKKQIKEKEILYKINLSTAKYFYKNLISSEGKSARNYLVKRTIDIKTQKNFGLGYSKKDENNLLKYLKNLGYKESDLEKIGLVSTGSYGTYDRFKDRLMFPIFDTHDKIIGFGGRILIDQKPKYLNSKESIIFNKRLNLYGLNIAKKTKSDLIYVVEGYMDVISMHQAGFNNTVASLGTALTEQQAKLLKRYVNEVILVYDSDEAGIKASLRAIPILKNVGLSVKVLNVINAKDPDEYIKKFGKEQFLSLSNTNSLSYIDYQIKIIKNKFNFNIHEEKIKALKQVISYINELNSDIEKDLYIKNVSKIFDIDKNIITKQIKIISNKDYINSKLKIENKKTNDENIEKQIDNIVIEREKIIISFMLNDIMICNKILKYIQYTDFLLPLHKNIVKNLCECIENDKFFDKIRFLNYFPQLSEQKYVNNIINEYDKYKNNDKILFMQLKNFKNYIIEKKIHNINLNLKNENIDDKESLEKELVKLLEEKINFSRLKQL